MNFQIFIFFQFKKLTSLTTLTNIQENFRQYDLLVIQLDNMKYYIFTLWLILVLTNTQQTYKKIFPNIDPEAVCLDGSPGAILFHQGSQPTKFLIFLYGGGTCGQSSLSQTIQTCYQRSKTRLGSSKFWDENLIGPGYLSTDPTKSSFANWTKALFIYCDGMAFQGYAKEPYEFKGVKIYARGSPMMRQNFQWLKINHNLQNAEKVIFTGISAGALGVAMWTNYLQRIVKNPSVVDTIPDSGLFIGYSTQDAKVNYKFSNVDEGTPFEECNRIYTEQPWRCKWLVDNYKYINGRILLLDSQYDIWEVIYFRNITCPQKGAQSWDFLKCTQNDFDRIQQNRQGRRTWLNSFIKDQKNSVWSISCSIHGFACFDPFFNTNYHQVPMGSGNTVKTAIDRFIFKRQRLILIDDVKWPYNSACAF